MHRVGRNLEGFARLEGLVRLALDLEDHRALHHIAALDPRMGMAAGAVARCDFRNGAHDIEAGRKIDGLERRALDAGLLRHRRNDDDRRNGGRNDERFLKCPFRNFLNRLNQLDFKGGGLIRGGVADVDA